MANQLEHRVDCQLGRHGRGSCFHLGKIVEVGGDCKREFVARNSLEGTCQPVEGPHDVPGTEWAGRECEELDAPVCGVPNCYARTMPLLFNDLEFTRNALALSTVLITRFLRSAAAYFLVL